ncbi:hypothetical protein VNO77_09007 [Canavalia gladiata]|uniref:Uncharacterized protein n=1 Tax=Canavalia gladiata TaxID=3824 RepID=A0AAN9MEA4_CANGL
MKALQLQSRLLESFILLDHLEETGFTIHHGWLEPKIAPSPTYQNLKQRKWKQQHECSEHQKISKKVLDAERNGGRSTGSQKLEEAFRIQEKKSIR